MRRKQQNIAIVGAGFAGLAVAWYLSQRKVRVTLYDKNGIGGGASGLAAGLLHPYAGAHAKKNWMADEALPLSLQLLSIASQALGKTVYSPSGILRIALNEEQHCDFRKCAELHDDVEWWDARKCQSEVSGLPDAPGIMIRSGVAVDCPLYLKGLAKACQQAGVEFCKQEISDLDSLREQDAIVINAGPSCKQFEELAHLPLKLIRGQLLEVSWPSELPPLPFPLNSKAYLVMAPHHRTCYIGATFERNYQEVTEAEKYLLPKAYALFPPIQETKTLHAYAGIRVSTPDHRPLMKQINERLFVLTGLGSKGLLYHALFAKRLVEKIYNSI